MLHPRGDPRPVRGTTAGNRVFDVTDEMRCFVAAVCKNSSNSRYKVDYRLSLKLLLFPPVLCHLSVGEGERMFVKAYVVKATRCTAAVLVQLSGRCVPQFGENNTCRQPTPTLECPSSSRV